MDGDQMTEEERQGLVNQLRLDLLLRGLSTTVLRRKFKEIYAKLNDGKEWKDGPEAGEKICWSKWGNGAFANANGKQQEMMKGGNIELWDLNCLQSVITQMLAAALKDRQGTPINWDQRWWAQISKIRILANIRHSIAHMPNETLSQDEFDEKWENAVDSLKVLGARSKEIKKIQQMCQSAFNLPSLSQQGQGQLPNSQKETSENIEQSTKEERKKIQELRAKIKELQLQNQSKVKDQDEIKDQKSKDEGQWSSENINLNPTVVSSKNELRADSLTRRGDLAGRSGDWDKALEFYTLALEIPDVSDYQRKKIYMNRSCVHLKILQTPEQPLDFNFNLPEFGDSETKKKFCVIQPPNPLQLPMKKYIQPKFMDEKLLKVDQRQPQKMTEEVKEFHLTAGIADTVSALHLSPGQKSPRAWYRFAQFHQLKGDWKIALACFDKALENSYLEYSQMEFDRNVLQLDMLNQTEVEDFDWIPGKKNQTMAGIAVRQDPEKWIKVMGDENNDPQQQLYTQVVKAHFLAQGLSLNVQGQIQKALEVTQQTFEEVVKLYEGAGNEGLPSGICNLGLLLQEGNGVPKDFSDAVRLFKMAAKFPINDKTPDWAKDGIVEAQYRLGLCYELGLGVGKDDRKALHWYEMASGGGYAKASRKLGDIYSRGLLGVSKDGQMARLCWRQAINNGDSAAEMSSSLSYLSSFLLNRNTIMNSLECFSKAIARYSQGGAPNLLAAVLDRKRICEYAIARALQKLIERSYSPYPGDIMVTGMDTYDRKVIDEPEPDEVSWNVPALVEHTLHKIHLLELVQTPEFQRKLEATPNWNSKFDFTNKLVVSSNFCIEGLSALEELNKLYRETLVKANKGQTIVETDYPPDLRKIPGVYQTILDEEERLVSIILNSFLQSIILVGAAYFRDESSLSLILRISQKIDDSPAADFGPINLEKITMESLSQRQINYGTAAVVASYIFMASGFRWENTLKRYMLEDKEYLHLRQPFMIISSVAGQGSLGKFEEAAADIGECLKNHYLRESLKSDLLFIQALCCKSAGLTRGTNAVIRKKIKEAMGIFQEFLSICPQDDPRRADAHYQLGLCTFYLEKMKVKGQVKSSAKDIWAKVLPHYIQGEKAEQDLPWKEFNLNYKPPVKLILQQKMKELKPSSSKKIPAQSLTSDLKAESEKLDILCVGRLVDPFFLCNPSSFPLKLREKRRVEIITTYRRFAKSTKDALQSLSSLSSDQQAEYLRLKSPFSGGDVLIPSRITNAYVEIVDPLLYIRLPEKEHPEIVKIVAITVVQDESGNVFNLKLITKHPTGTDKLSKIEELQMGDRIILHRPCIRLDADGGTSLVVEDVPKQVFQIQSESELKEQESGGGHMKMASKCGYCGKMGEALQRCSKCQAIYYCGKECQMADWNELKHKWICPFLKCDCQFCQKKG